MVELTERAAREIKSLLELEGDDVGLRVYPVGYGCRGVRYGLALEAAAEGDVEEVVSGVRVFIPGEIKKFLEEAEIDFVDGDEGKGFIIHTLSSSCNSCSECY